MTAKTEVYNSVETELINLVCQSPAILNKLREVLGVNQMRTLARDEPAPPHTNSADRPEPKPLAG